MAEEKKGAKALIESVLGTTRPAEAPDPAPEPAPVSAPEDAAAAELAAQEAEASDLIEVYFELEEPAERDALFEQLIVFDVPLVTEFLRTMMLEDEDEYVRAAAAAELARRGVAEAIELLTSDLEDPEEPFFFENAVRTLAEVLGAEFFPTLVTLWQDPNRDADQRREAMLGLEIIDPEQALAEFISFIDEIEDVGTMPDDQIEVAMMAFVRHEHVTARPVLEALRQRVLSADIDAIERAELAGFLAEGIALL